MTAHEIVDLNRARAALARQCHAITKRMGAIDLAPVSMAEDLTRILLAIEAVDRALVVAGHPYLPPELQAGT
ncbi:hypothetical protein [Methylobacterium soli]|jgi:hypothetical protein|uniref:Histidine kinase n=1 Tax=Methylobacterium soli TaxID=553447 RepID=A0A6L3T812_9HYPH|nr:hypothetical protein [Methylobacterium soli]KAB1081373.1 hypothetical protein F6X53_03435 [Methylobacterium soli]GJE45399.1 hypothetical protein AEGHOMDF_4593 [Methylobacterium soli]